MSNALECVVHTDSTQFYSQDFKKESNLIETGISLDVTQDENKCQTNIPTLRQVSSRKREASNILVECAKKRENLQNISYASDTSLWSAEVKPDLDVSDSDSLEEVADVVKTNGTFVGIDSPMSVELSDSSAADSGIERSHVRSMDQSTDVSSAICSDEEIYSSTTVTSTDDDLKTSLDCIQTSDKSMTDPTPSAFNQDLDDLCFGEKSSISDDKPKTIKPALVQSLFTDIPPVLYFPSQDEKVEKLPKDISSHLKWKLTTITPVIVKDLVTSVGFELLEMETTENWLGSWGKHLKCLTFRSLLPFQKVNHFPGGYHLGRKDRLWRNYNKMLTKYGAEFFDFFPPTFILPADKKLLRAMWDNEFCWIIKPCASARGTGVKVIHKWCQVPKEKPYVVQKYISDPYLINGTKFDLRMYVLVPSIEPLRIYVYENGLVRFASKKYCTTNNSLKNRFIHLTNYSINRRSASYASNNDENLCQGHKWSLKCFWTYMSESGIDVDKIKKTIIDMIIKTIICSEGPISRQVKIHAKSAYNCFELFGFDIMLDKDLKPWLLEVNITPSLHTKSILDSKIKSPMIRDMLNIIGYELPQQLSEESSYPKGNRHKLLQFKEFSTEERKKHSFYTFKYCDVDMDILQQLTPDDLSCLMDAEDELQRAGEFTRIFPTTETRSYLTYFDHVRYYNVLLDSWEHVYGHDRQKGIEYLKSSYDRLRFKNKTDEDTQLDTEIPEAQND